MKPLRIVVVMIEPPLPFGNASARWFYVLLKGLQERGHQVTAFAACSNPAEMEAAREVFPAPRFDLRCYPFPERRGVRSKLETIRRPYSYMFGDDLRRDLEATLEEGFDVLHMEQLWSGWLAERWRKRALVVVHYLFSIDLEYTRPRTLRERFERWMMLSAEKRLLHDRSHLSTLSPRLTEAVRKQSKGASVHTVPIGLDLNEYPYIPDDQRTVEPVISIIGNMNWYPSHSAAERLLTRLWPEIRRRMPSARLQIVGWNARTVLGNFLGEPGVTIEENVPDIRPCFERTGVFLYAPGRGSGMKIKILEALAFGVPVVTTSEGVEGLPAVDGLHAGVCEDDAGMIERTLRLLNDPAMQNRQRAAGRELLEAHCGPKPTLDAIESVYATMLDR